MRGILRLEMEEHSENGNGRERKREERNAFLGEERKE